MKCIVINGWAQFEYYEELVIPTQIGPLDIAWSYLPT